MKICKFEDVEMREVTEEGAKGVSIRWVISKDDGARNFYMRVFDVQPGGHTPYHQHEWEHEVFILEGDAEVVTADGPKKAPAGSVVFAKPQEFHQFRNSGKGLMRFICLIPAAEK
ncbi:MAG: cupin domain-containing protein [Candidatus Abyssobacteria bacterium SURF_5]|uniref:Cupin domain-containing protein n=1 Tax=Abyssobacteria bacterium (strain SURF_5) TaxID=2093360 RepID=A0A3A4NYL2_ABYX5|nr:MAG: cupin domain-containing protein [Candidatus Abyssubacteria bacterium SURF_5]